MQLSVATLLPSMQLSWHNINMFPLDDADKSLSSRLSACYAAITREKPKRIRRGRILDNGEGVWLIMASQ